MVKLTLVAQFMVTFEPVLSVDWQLTPGGTLWIFELGVPLGPLSYTRPCSAAFYNAMLD